MINVRISPTAFLKMQALVMGHDKEVGWYGTAEKLDEDTFRIKDILPVYPQYVSSAYIDDVWQGEMDEWFDSLSDEDYNSKRFHGHSHVNMGAYQSGTDKSSYETFKHQNAHARENRFTLELVINKRADMFWKVHDADKDIEYDNKDINVQIEIAEGLTMEEYYEESKSMVKELRNTGSFCFKGKPSKVTSTSKYNAPKTKGYGGKKSAKKEKEEQLDIFDDYDCFDEWDYYGYNHYGGNYGGNYYEADETEEEAVPTVKAKEIDIEAVLKVITGKKYIVNAKNKFIVETDIMEAADNIIFDVNQNAYKILADTVGPIQEAKTLYEGMVEAMRGSYGEFDLIMPFAPALNAALTPDEFDNNEAMFESEFIGYSIVPGMDCRVLALYIN